MQAQQWRTRTARSPSSCRACQAKPNAAVREQPHPDTPIMYLGNPTIGARGLDAAIVTALGGAPRFHKANLIPQTVDLLAA